MPFQKHFRNLLRKKVNFAAEKYPQTNTVKILHESFFAFKIKHVM